jgi:hypothetical protein
MGWVDRLRVTGHVTLVLTGPDGAVKEVREQSNLVVNTGLGHVTARLAGTSQGVMSHIGIGSGSTAAAGGDTALGSQVGARKTLDSTTRTGASNQSIVYVGTFYPGESSGSIREAGIFNASTSGVMLCRTVFGVVTKAAQDTLQITWTLTFSA